MPINSKKKGSHGELELVHELNNKGFETRRTAQFCGNTGDASDITGLDFIHPEVKRVEHLNIDNAMAQAVRDSKGSTKLPTVFHRKNHKDWLVTMRLDDWLELYRCFLDNKPTEEPK